MSVKLKKINEQVMVITGATSGIGLTTARMAAEMGAKLVLAARNEEALRVLTEEIRAKGGEAVAVAADVGKQEDIRRISDRAVEAFGGFDTWVNNAGVSIYGKITDVPTEDHRRLFETNFWGVVYGSQTAAEHLREKGGAIINVGSTVSDRAIPYQGMYSASKHAVKGFTDAFRMELEADGAPVSVTLVKPAAINTPYIEHAKNYLDGKPDIPPPVYAPETVAETILYCAEHPTRDVFVGGGGKAISLMGKFAPRTTDIVMEYTMKEMQTSEARAEDSQRVGLHESRDKRLNQRGDHKGYVAESSIYTKASLHPVITGAAVALGAGLALSLWNRNREIEH